MTTKPIGGVRRAQLITTYGVGALIAVDSESFMVAGIDRWPDPIAGRDKILHEPRLQQQLQVQGFRLPPASDREWEGDVPVVRFPLWHSCPECGLLAPLGSFGVSRGTARCQPCDRELVPSRFVMCCQDGHIDDFPYFNWVHKGGSPATVGSNHKIKIAAKGRSAALRDIVLSCSCDKTVSLEGALGRGQLVGISGCTGKRPWLPGVEAEACQRLPRAMQRGASGVWFADVRSAISIPPWSEGIQKLISRNWNILRKIANPRSVIEETELADGTGYTVDEIVKAIEHRRLVESGLDDDNQANLRDEEYEALSRPTPEKAVDQDFVCIPADQQLDAEHPVDLVMQVTRLREVRALRAFTRIDAPNGPGVRTASLYREDSGPGWLPAIEVIGEGVFLRLDQAKVTQWEQRPDVITRISPLDDAYRQRFESRGLTPDRTITPRLVLVHTLAHAIIHEWSLECGYPTAALRERLYASGRMAGLLLYTATSDSAGSLGGIVAQVENEDLGASIQRSLNRISWCSADPLCLETPVGGVDNLNRAACHACILLPESSCEEFNTLLDRAVLIGLPDSKDVAFFPMGKP